MKHCEGLENERSGSNPYSLLSERKKHCYRPVTRLCRTQVFRNHSALFRTVNTWVNFPQLKKDIKKMFWSNAIKLSESNLMTLQVDQWTATRWCSVAWKEITPDTIWKCFFQSNLVVGENTSKAIDLAIQEELCNCMSTLDISPEEVEENAIEAFKFRWNTLKTLLSWRIYLPLFTTKTFSDIPANPLSTSAQIIDTS